MTQDQITQNNKKMKIQSHLTGAEEVFQERMEQKHKHGWDESDDQYTNGELVQAALFCLGQAEWPEGWMEEFKQKILAKDQVGKLRVAGAFMAAEIDRLKRNKS